MLRIFFLYSIVVVTIINIVTVDAKEIVYMGLGERRDVYHTELLEEVFKHSPLKEHQIKRYNLPLPHHRAFLFLAENRDIDIVLGYATEERDENYLAVPIPILKGLNGWRLSVVHKQSMDIFKNKTNLKQLRKFTPGQVHSWTDYKILVSNGFNPASVSNFDALYYMLHGKRIDYLPRSILEIHREVDYMSSKGLDVAIDPNILIIYPTAFYFYVNKNNVELAEKLKQGLETIIANGIFDKTFYQHYADLIKRVENEQRYIFNLKNPLLPKSVPINRTELWIR